MPPTVHYAAQLASLTDAYEAKGVKEAGQHRPTTDSVRPDRHESDLRGEASRWLTNEQRQFDAVLTEAQATVISVEQKLVDLGHRTSQLVTDTSLNSSIEAEMSADRRALVNATVTRLNAEVALNVFRAANRISDTAQYPESKVLHLGVILGLALAETVVNAFFYENSQGLLGGFVVALAISIMNMGAALLLGMGVRYRNLAAPDKQALGWFCLLMFLFVTIFFNTLFATFRSTYQLVVDPNDLKALQQAFALAWGPAFRIFLLDAQFHDMLSFVLFGIGLLLSFAAFYKGMTWDDRYPGHGPRDRTLKAAQLEEGRLQTELLEKVKAFLHKRRSELQAVAAEPTALIGRMTARKGELQTAKSLLAVHSRAIQRDFALVLGVYRSSNTSTRRTDPPTYFSDVPDLIAGISGSEADPVLAQMDQLQVQITIVRDANQEALNQQINEHQHNAAAVLTRTYGEFLKDVIRDAKDHINRTTSSMHRAATGVTHVE